MAVAFVQGAAHATAGAVTTQTATFGAAVTAGNTVVGVVSWDNTGGALSTVKDGAGNSATVLDNILDSGNTQRGASFYLPNSPGGSTTIVATFASSNGATSISVAEYSGVATAPLDGHTGQLQVNPGTGSNVITSTAITTTVNGDMVVGLVAGTSGQLGSTFSAGTSPIAFTDRPTTAASASGTAGLRIEDFIQTTAASIAATWTQSGASPDSTIAFVVALSPPGAAAGISLGKTPGEIFIPGTRQGPMRGLRATRAFPPFLAPIQAFPMPDMAWRKKAPAPDLTPFPQFYQTVPPPAPLSMPDVAIASKKPHWIDTALALVQVTAAAAPPVVVAMPDMPVKTKVQHWTDLVFPLQAQPIVFYGAPALPARSWRNKQQQWADVVFPFAPPLPTTPSTAVPIMLDMAQKTKPRQWLDLFLPIKPPAATPSTAAFALPDMSVPSHKQRWLDLFLPIYGPLPQTPTTAAFAMADVSIRTKKQHWLDLALPLFQAPAAVVTPFAFDMRWFDMPMPQKSGRQTLLEQLLGIPPTGACSLLQEDGVSRIILEDGSGFLLLENCTPLITSFFDNRWLDMPVPKRQQWLDYESILKFTPPAVGPTTPSTFFDMRWLDGPKGKKQQWLDLFLPLVPPLAVGPPTPSSWYFPIPDRSVKTKARQWIEIPPIQEPPTISLGAPALCDMSIPSRKQQWLDLSIGLFPPVQVVTAPPVILAMPDVSMKTRQRQWLDLFLPIYGPLPPTPSTAAFPMLDMAVKTKQRQWLDYQWAQFVAQPTQTPSFALMAMLEMLPRMNSRRQQWLDLPAVLFYPTLPRTPANFFDDRWLDMPRPRPFVTEATQGLIGLQTTVPPPIPPAPQLVPPRFRRDPWDRDEWGRFKPGSGFHGV